MSVDEIAKKLCERAYLKHCEECKKERVHHFHLKNIGREIRAGLLSGLKYI